MLRVRFAGVAPAPVSRYSVPAVPSLRRALLPAIALLAAGCDEQASAGTPDAAPPAAPAPTATLSARPAASSAPRSSAAAPTGELKVLKLVFTTGVKNKEPVDAPKAAEAGQRIYAHTTLRNRTEGARNVSLVFLVGGQQRTKIDLSVDPSWSYRTWGYVTLRAGDTGEVVAELRDEGGEVMERARIPIKPAQGK